MIFHKRKISNYILFLFSFFIEKKYKKVFFYQISSEIKVNLKFHDIVQFTFVRDKQDFKEKTLNCCWRQFMTH